MCKTYSIFRKEYGFSHYSLVILNIPILHFYYKHNFGWVRVFGRGLSWKDVTIYGKTFSEKNGFVKRLYIYKWSITII